MDDKQNVELYRLQSIQRNAILKQFPCNIQGTYRPTGAMTIKFPLSEMIPCPSSRKGNPAKENLTDRKIAIYYPPAGVKKIATIRKPNIVIFSDENKFRY